LIHQICDECAEAIAYRDSKKEALDTVDAELDAEIREALAKNSKVTESIVKGAIQVHHKHEEAFNEYNQAKLAAAKAAALERAITTRSDALKELSKLYISGYFAIDSTKRNVDAQEIVYNKRRELLASKRLKE
jgi:translation initiation factor 2B subunit (eIF-2B alpha/beta/delta family)